MLFFYTKYEKSSSRSNKGIKRFYKISWINSGCRTKKNNYLVYSVCEIQNSSSQLSIEFSMSLHG